MYSDVQRLHLVETAANRVTAPLLEALAHTVARSPHWTIHLAIGDAGLHVFADRLIPCGRRFWDCDSVRAVADRCAGPVDFGPVPSSWPEGYDIWHDLVCGTWNRDRLPAGPDRQWAYVLNYLSKTPKISQFTYRRRVVYDLHPATRTEFVIRFLGQFAARLETSDIGIETVVEDAGYLLSRSEGVASDQLLGSLAAAQLTLERKNAFFFWSRVIYGAEKGGPLRPTISNELALFLLSKTLPLNAEVVSLSALLGLARLKRPEVSEQAVRLRAQNPHWGPSVHDWLRELSARPDAYPYPASEIELSSLGWAELKVTSCQGKRSAESAGYGRLR